MSNTKKLLSFICLVLLTIVLVGCEFPVPQGKLSRTESEAKQDLATAVSRLTFTTQELVIETDEIALTKNFASIKEITYTWTSSNEQVIRIVDGETSYKGIVTRPTDADVKVTLTCVVSVTYTKLDDGTPKRGTVSETKEFEFEVKMMVEAPVITAAEAKATKPGTVVAVEGIVTSIMYNNAFDKTAEENSIRGIFVKDDTDGIYVYGPNKITAAIGDKVKVTAEVADYYGTTQLSNTKENPISVKVLASDQEAPAYTDATTSLSEVLKTDKATRGGKFYNLYVKVEKVVDGSNTNINFVDPYTGEKVQVYYRSSFANIQGIEIKNTLVETMEPLVDKYIMVPTVVYYYNSTDAVTPVRVQLGMGTIEIVEAPVLTDEDMVNQAEVAVKALAGTYTKGETVALFATHTTTGCEVQWTASVENVIDLTTGKIADDATPQTVTLTAVITKGEATKTVTIDIVIEEIVEPITVAEAIAAAVDTKIAIEGTVEVVFASKRYFYVKDATGSILVYSGLPTGMKEGDKVKVTGTRAAYNGCPQIASGADVELVEAGTWTMSTPRVVTIAEILAYTAETAPFGEYLQVTGKVVKGTDNYYYLADATDDTKQISLYNSVTDTITAYEGKVVTINIYFYNNASKDWTGLMRTIYVGRDGEYVLPKLTDQDQAQAIVDGIKVDEVATENFTLPTVEGVVWTMKEASQAATLNGNEVTVTRGETDVTVVFVATATVGEATVTKEFSVVVKGTAVVAEQTIELTPETFKTNTNVILTKVVENTKYTNEFTIQKNGGSIISTSITGVTKVVAEVYGSYDNMKMYAGTSAAGTAVTATKENIGASGSDRRYTYTFTTPTNEFCFVNPSSHDVQVYSVTIYYTGTAGTPTEQDLLNVDLPEIQLPTTLVADTTFPVTLTHGSTVAYTSSNPEALSITAEGAVTVVRGETDVTVTVSYVVTKGTATSEGHTADITVTAKPSDTPTVINITGDFMVSTSGDKTAPEGWSLSVGKGAYGTGWQSFRSNGEYAKSPMFGEQTSVDVSFTYYLNNTGSGSSKIKFEALDGNGKVVVTVTSDELNAGETGEANAKTINATLAGSGITQVKVSFVKASGGNIAFSTITIVTTAK